ncbi:MAG: ABC transporter substrate-binding protein [Alphaproteobacteria bacterium]|nr:ABC transporter substrate-binding protein [Alphaproteobacteria bacterium]
MTLFRRLFLSAALGALALTASPNAGAQTPARSLVIAKNINDIISLDPAQTFEFTGGEIVSNISDRLIQYDVDEPTRLLPGLAESWKTTGDGKTIVFTLREAKFSSGNPVRPEDVVFSFARVVALKKPPAFILAQLGWTPENVAQMVRKTGDREITVSFTGNFSAAFALNAIAARPGAIVDQIEAMKNEKNGDLGNEWLTHNSAGSGPFRLARIRPGEIATLAASPTHFRGAPQLQQVIYRHVPEAGAQRLLLEKGDVDIARELGADDLETVGKTAGLRVERYPAATIHFFTLNLKHEKLRNPALWEAMRYLVDYEGIASKLLRGTMRVHQAFLPVGFPGAVEDTPYKLDVAKAREILAKAGIQNLEVEMDVIEGQPFAGVSQTLQASMAQAGIKLSLVTGSISQVITKYRARNHQMMLVYWNPDFMDAHSNAKAFSYAVDLSDGSPQSTTTWRNHWLIPELSKRTMDALGEGDPAKRVPMYQALQRDVMKESPFVIMFQAQNATAMRANVQGYKQGVVNDLILYRGVTKQ